MYIVYSILLLKIINMIERIPIVGRREDYIHNRIDELRKSNYWVFQNCRVMIGTSDNLLPEFALCLLEDFSVSQHSFWLKFWRIALSLEPLSTYFFTLLWIYFGYERSWFIWQMAKTILHTSVPCHEWAYLNNFETFYHKFIVNIYYFTSFCWNWTVPEVDESVNTKHLKHFQRTHFTE